MNKMKSHAFGKDIYYLGVHNGENLWIEAAKWECDWYWGFGYVKTYTNNDNPSASRGISSHSHYSQFLFKDDGKCRLSEYDIETHLTESEQWTLSELMCSFYRLREMAELTHQGGAHLTTNPCKDILKNDSINKEINAVMLPAIFEAVYSLLSPKVTAA